LPKRACLEVIDVNEIMTKDVAKARGMHLFCLKCLIQRPLLVIFEQQLQHTETRFGKVTIVNALEKCVNFSVMTCQKSLPSCYLTPRGLFDCSMSPRRSAPLPRSAASPLYVRHLTIDSSNLQFLTPCQLQKLFLLRLSYPLSLYYNPMPLTLLQCWL